MYRCQPEDPYLLRRQVGRVRDNEIGPAGGQAIIIGKDVALHGLHAGPRHIGGQVGPGVGAFLHTGHSRAGQMPGNAQAQAARARTEVVDDGRFCALQQLDGRLADDLAVGAGAEHAAADLERKVHKIPLAQQVLQRLTFLISSCDLQVLFFS